MLGVVVTAIVVRIGGSVSRDALSVVPHPARRPPPAATIAASTVVPRAPLPIMGADATGGSMRTVGMPRRTLVGWRRQRPPSSTSRAPNGPPAQYHLYPNGVGIAVHEWGDEDAPPLLLVHGGMDFARTYDVFAPKLAAAGWRVVGWDARGHGDSAHVELYSWDADMRDALAVFDHVSPGRPLPVIATLQGWCADDAARRRPVVPLLAPRQHGRHPVDAADARHRRARTVEDDGRRTGRLARPPAPHRDVAAPTGDDRRTRPASRGDEPAAVRSSGCAVW